MKLMRVGDLGAERPVVRVDSEHYVDVSDTIKDFDAEFFAGGGIKRLRGLVADRVDAGRVTRLASARIGAPVARPHQILCIGLNYHDHATETGQAVPAEPILFTKAPNTLVGPNDDIVTPPGSTKLDWEVELGVVIGRHAHRVESPAEAAELIAGFTVVNDVSERAFQLERGGQWTKGKSAPTFNPTGPWLVTPDEGRDILDRQIWLDVNGIRRQDGSTTAMIFDPCTIIVYLSQFVALEPGDLINTGTPPGIGMAMDPPTYLAPGDVIELGIDGLGVQRQTVVGPRLAARDAATTQALPRN